MTSKKNIVQDDYYANISDPTPAVDNSSTVEKKPKIKLKAKPKTPFVEDSASVDSHTKKPKVIAKKKDKETEESKKTKESAKEKKETKTESKMRLVEREHA